MANNTLSHGLELLAVPYLSRNDSLLAVATTALACHLIFKRYETRYIPAVILLLFALPASLSALLAPHYGGLAPLVAFSVYYAVLSTSIVTYRLSPWHPLARYPGPLPAKVTKWWLYYKVASGKQHLYIHHLHQTYGDIVRTGPNDVCIRNADAVAPALGTTGLPKSDVMWAMGLEPPVTAMIAQRAPADHARRRRPWTRAFSTAAIKEYLPVIVKRATQLCDALGNEKGQTDLARWFSYFTYDVMGDMVYGGGSEMLANGDKDGLWSMFRAGGEGQMLYYSMPWLAHFAKRLPMSREVKKMRQFMLMRTAERYKKGATSKDLFYYLSNEDGAEKQQPSAAQVISDGVLATLAASDTTSGVLGNLFWMLLRHPQYYKRLQAEVDKFYPAGDNALDPAHHSKMVFLDAVLNEVLRLYPIGPSGSPRAPLPGQGDKVIGPYYIPEGTYTRIHTWSLHRDARYFTRPETYWPERWLIAEGHEPAPAGEPFVHNPNAFIPFSFGPSNCVGKNFARVEMRMVVCHLVQNLELHLADGWDPDERERTMEDRFAMNMKELPVVVSRRM